jgi:hypothetical protein
MRTQLILTTAALGLAGAISAQAQVYSVNAVGYVNVTIPAKKFAMQANQLNAGVDKANKITDVIPSAKDGTIVYKYVRNADGTGGYASAGFEFGEWSDKALTLPPGAGFFIYNGDAADQTITFVGEVPQGTLTTSLVKGLNQAASQVPQAGLLETVLAYPKADGDIVYKFDTATQNYVPFSVEFGSWSPAEPAVAVAEGLFVNKAANASWTRTFTVN